MRSFLVQPLRSPQSAIGRAFCLAGAVSQGVFSLHSLVRAVRSANSAIRLREAAERAAPPPSARRHAPTAADNQGLSSARRKASRDARDASVAPMPAASAAAAGTLAGAAALTGSGPSGDTTSRDVAIRIAPDAGARGSRQLRPESGSFQVQQHTAGAQGPGSARNKSAREDSVMRVEVSHHVMSQGHEGVHARYSNHCCRGLMVAQQTFMWRHTSLCLLYACINACQACLKIFTQQDIGKHLPLTLVLSVNSLVLWSAFQYFSFSFIKLNLRMANLSGASRLLTVARLSVLQRLLVVAVVLSATPSIWTLWFVCQSASCVIFRSFAPCVICSLWLLLMLSKDVRTRRACGVADNSLLLEPVLQHCDGEQQRLVSWGFHLIRAAGMNFHSCAN